MLAAYRAAERPREGEDFIGNYRHFLYVGGIAQIEIRTDVQLAVSGVAVEGGVKIILGSDALQTDDVFCELFVIDGNIFNEGYGFFASTVTAEQRDGVFTSLFDFLPLGGIEYDILLCRQLSDGLGGFLQLLL